MRAHALIRAFLYRVGAGNSFLGGLSAGLLLAENDVYEGEHATSVPCAGTKTLEISFTFIHVSAGPIVNKNELTILIMPSRSLRFHFFLVYDRATRSA